MQVIRVWRARHATQGLPSLTQQGPQQFVLFLQVFQNKFVWPCVGWWTSQMDEVKSSGDGPAWLDLLNLGRTPDRGAVTAGNSTNTVVLMGPTRKP